MTKRTAFAIVLLTSTWIAVPKLQAGAVAPTKPSQIVSAPANQFKFDSPSCPLGVRSSTSATRSFRPRSKWS